VVQLPLATGSDAHNSAARRFRLSQIPSSSGHDTKS
jgi:hypothetical protein